MSRLQLSDSPVDAVQGLLTRHDDKAREPEIAIQYPARLEAAPHTPSRCRVSSGSSRK
jgi:hypothetical protein